MIFMTTPIVVQLDHTVSEVHFYDFSLIFARMGSIFLYVNILARHLVLCISD